MSNTSILDIKDTLFELLNEMRLIEKPTEKQYMLINSLKYHIGQMEVHDADTNS